MSMGFKFCNVLRNLAPVRSRWEIALAFINYQQRTNWIGMPLLRIIKRKAAQLLKVQTVDVGKIGRGFSDNELSKIISTASRDFPVPGAPVIK